MLMRRIVHKCHKAVNVLKGYVTISQPVTLKRHTPQNIFYTISTIISFDVCFVSVTAAFLTNSVSEWSACLLDLTFYPACCLPRLTARPYRQDCKYLTALRGDCVAPGGLSLPYSVPLTEYDDEDTPWQADVPHRRPDVNGASLR